VIAAKAVAFFEALQPEFREYQNQVKKNAQALAVAFTKRNYSIISGGTDNHLLLLDLRSKFPDLTGKVAEKTLVTADIPLTKYGTFRFSLSLPDIRYQGRYSGRDHQGLKEHDMDSIVALIDEVLSNIDNPAVIEKVKKRSKNYGRVALI
jgi:glycine hydroxymethyltransferase